MAQTQTKTIVSDWQPLRVQVYRARYVGLNAAIYETAETFPAYQALRFLANYAGKNGFAVAAVIVRSNERALSN